MNMSDLIAEIDAEISRLRGARSLLAGAGFDDKSKRQSPSAGRPPKTAKRQLSPEARERIRQAQIKRWAKAKKTGVK